jgi:hypothetical protein
MRHESRRSFIVRGVAAAATTGFALSGRISNAFAATTASTLSRSRFTPHRGKQFTMVKGMSKVPVVLTEISDLPEAAGSDSRFALVFRAARTETLRDGIYVFKRAGFTSTSLFVVRVDRGVKYAHFQAVVNRAS